MKKSFSGMPETMADFPRYGFSWMDFVTSIPSPVFLVTGYKADGKPNACLHSWTSFVGDDDGFYAILSLVNTAGHMYQSARETGVMVLNFPSAALFPKCLDTIRNNQPEDDEIALAGLTAVPAETVNAPSVSECFLNLECKLLWERPMHEGSRHAVLCAKVNNIVIDEAHLDENGQGRIGSGGYLYNIMSAVNPLTGEVWKDAVGELHKVSDM